MPDNNLNIDLFISTQCPHCAQALEILTKAVKQGVVSQLNIINLNTVANPQDYSSIRSVPFIKIGDFEFSGNIKQSELDDWIQASQENKFPHYYFSMKLSDGNINQAERLIKQNPEYWFTLIQLLQDSETKLQVKIGSTSIFETHCKDLINSSQCDEVTHALIQATKTDEHATRVDLIYILSLIYSELKANKKNNNELSDFIKQTLNDKSDEIKEIIEDAIA